MKFRLSQSPFLVRIRLMASLSEISYTALNYTPCCVRTSRVMVQKSAFSAYLSLEFERDVGLECVA